MFSYRFGSRNFSLNLDELRSIARGAAVAVAGALVPVVASLVGVLDDGSLKGAALAAVAAIVVNTLRKFVTDNATTPQ